ncbi:MAG: hypothetical protein POG74_10850 [Acidocella sp.]|nr:hypothetical protein [Acidocella sp.]
MRINLRFLVVALPLLTANCASIVAGTSESLSVKTVSGASDLSGASCTLGNDKGSWTVVTPGTVKIHQSSGSLNVTCAANGYEDNTVSESAVLKNVVMGNILVGGLVGTAIDLNDGAAYSYPVVILVPLQVAPPSTNTASAGTATATAATASAANAPPVSMVPLN